MYKNEGKTMSTTAFMPEKQSTTARTNNKRNILGSAIAGGAFATATQRLMLPQEAKTALRVTRYSQDAYVGKMQKAAMTAMKNTGKTFNIDSVLNNAKNLHSEMLEIAKPIRTSLVKTFIGTAAAVTCAKLLVNMVINNQIKASKQKEE